MSTAKTEPSPPYHRYTRRVISDMSDVTPSKTTQHQHRWSLLNAWNSLRHPYAPRDSTGGSSSGDEKRSKRKEDGSGEGGKRRRRKEDGNSEDGSKKKKGSKDKGKFEHRVKKEEDKRWGKRLPRKKVSLLLRRKGRSPTKSKDGKRAGSLKVGEQVPKTEVGQVEGKENIVQIKRALSLTQTPVTKREGEGEGDAPGERKLLRNRSLLPAEAVEIKAKVDVETFQKLQNFARTGSMYSVKGDAADQKEVCLKAPAKEGEKCKVDRTGGDGVVVGGVCLEDFADHDSNYDFMDDPCIVPKAECYHQDMLSLKMSGATDALSDEGLNLTMESNGEGQRLTWIGNERELEAFFAETGIIDELEIEEVNEVCLKEFEVSNELEAEWEAMGREHNTRFGAWSDARTEREGNDAQAHQSAHELDIRSLADEYAQMHSKPEERDGRHAEIM